MINGQRICTINSPHKPEFEKKKNTFMDHFKTEKYAAVVRF